MKKLAFLDDKKFILITLILAVLLYVDFAYLIKSQFKGIKKNAKKIERLNKEIETLSRDLARAKQEKPKAEQAIKAKEFIPPDSLPYLLQTISSIANKNNVKISEIKPSKIEASAQFKDISAQTISLSLFCDYHNLGRFINDLENQKEFISVEEMIIVPDGGNFMLQKANLVLRTYVKK